jgi:isopenicillin N synthase-like dioxygenase
MATQETTQEFPVIDLSDLYEGRVSAEELAKRLRDIQEDIGFYAVINHGIPSGLLDAAFGKLREFFDEPVETKSKQLFSQKTMGYIPMGQTIYITEGKINNNTKVDLNETLTLAFDRPDDHAFIQQGIRFTGNNPWPNIPGFRSAVVTAQEALIDLGRRMLPLYAMALDKSPEFFDRFFANRDHMAWSRNSHYPSNEAEDNQFGISPHSDHSFLTLLPLSREPGLQVLRSDGSWMVVPPIENAIVINSGQFFERWTNDRFIASPHRVVPPKNDRYSMALFFNPHPDTVANGADFLTDEITEPVHKPMTMLEYASWYVDTNYSEKVGGTQAL